MVERNPAGHGVVVAGADREVDPVAVTRRVQHPPGPRPVLDAALGLGIRPFGLRAGDQHPGGAVAQDPLVAPQAERVADLRVEAVGADDEVGLDGAAVLEGEFTGRGRRDRPGAGDDLGAEVGGPLRQRAVQQRSQHGHQPLPGLMGVLEALDDPRPLVPHVEPTDRVRGRHQLVVDAESLQCAQAVLPHVQPGAQLPQGRGLLPDACAPTPLGEGDGAGQSRQASPGDLHGRFGHQEARSTKRRWISLNEAACSSDDMWPASGNSTNSAPATTSATARP